MTNHQPYVHLVNRPYSNSFEQWCSDFNSAWSTIFPHSPPPLPSHFIDCPVYKSLFSKNLHPRLYICSLKNAGRRFQKHAYGRWGNYKI